MGILLLPRLTLLLLSLRCCFSGTKCKGKSLEVGEEWVANLIPKNYNDKLPPYRPGCPLAVNLTIVPWGIGEISFEHMHFEVNMYVVLSWVDYRLNITNPRKEEIFLPEKKAALLWTPDVAFRNCLHCDIIKFNNQIHKLNLKGNVLEYFVRTSAKLFCDFDLSNYPMDKHICFIEVITASDRKETVVLQIGEPFLAFLRNSSIPQFKVSNLSTGMCSVSDGMSVYTSCIEYQITFIRQLTYHMMLTYSPSFLIVVLSWMSFWLEMDAAPPRVAIGLTSLLTLATQFSDAQKNLPPVSYAKAIDVWMFTCIFMVFGSLLEFGVAYNTQNKVVNASAGMNHWTKKPSRVRRSYLPKKNKNTIDSASKIAFPLIFVAFNVIYWTYFGIK